MAATIEMGEVDDIHSKEDTTKGDGLINGVLSKDSKMDDNSNEKVAKEEPMQVDENDGSEDDTSKHSDKDGSVKDSTVKDSTELPSAKQESNLLKSLELREAANGATTKPEAKRAASVVSASDDDIQEIHTIDSDDEDMDTTSHSADKNVKSTDKLSETDKSPAMDDSDDVMFVDEEVHNVKENGTAASDKSSDDCQVIESSPPKAPPPLTPRRKSRKAQQVKREIREISDESDIEEILEEDPLAEPETNKSRKSSTIVVNDTKRLVEIASKSNAQNSGKKEPTLVIIDTNSILSGRGPVPVTNSKTTSSSAAAGFNAMSMQLPTQGIYPPNMRATITPIPMNNTKQAAPPPPPVLAAPPPTAILPSLTDDMFVVEAPSFIVPYVYEKPPVKDFKEYVTELAAEIKRAMLEEEKNGDDDDDIEEVKIEKADETDPLKLIEGKPYFESPIGKFFVDIGSSLVQEYVQTDLLKQQMRKRNHEGGTNSETNRTIQSLLKSLEYTKENNEPYRAERKRCEFCNYKTDSILAMAYHLETPHMKSFVYRCNFCTYEVRSPHDILFHMEAEHCLRGRLERMPSFHQCPNCPFEDNQKGKLSRHLVACAKKFKPERNLEPPVDWEPPAKIPRQPRLKTNNLAMTAAMYQAMSKSTQAQFLKSQAAQAQAELRQHQQLQLQQQQQQQQQSAANRGRGRPSLLSSKQPKKNKIPDLIPTNVPGAGSVLVPTNFQLGNQLYQVIGGPDLSGRLGGSVGLIPPLSSAANTVTIQNSPSKSKSVHQPSISITPLPRGTTSSALNVSPTSGATGGGGGTSPTAKPGDSNSKNSFVICEICDGYIKDLEQLRNHMQWIHKVKIHPKMIYNRPPLNCQKCQFRFFTDQGLERHLLGSHGLVTSSMQEAANKCKDSGRCPVCGRVYQWKLLNHVARDHNMTLKPAHLSYKCTVCTATFGMYKQFENHVYSAHSVVAKRSIDKTKNSSTSSPSSSSKNESLLKPLKINDEITIIPQMPKSNGAGSAKDGGSSSTRTMSASSSRSKLDKKESALSGSAIDSGEIQIINLG